MKMKKNIITIAVVFFVLLAGALYIFTGQGMKMVEEQGDTTELVLNTSVPEQTADINSSANETSTIFVHVCGAVKQPDVYELPAGARVCDAIKAASGFRKKADDTFINQAEALMDGQQIYVPFKDKEGSNVQTSTEQTSSNTGKVSINNATAEELMTLPGIGESKAQSILTYREEQGAFQTIEDLMNIPGIKEGVYNQLKDYIVL